MKNRLFILSSKHFPAAFIASICALLIAQHLVFKSNLFWRFCYRYSNPMYDDAIRVSVDFSMISLLDKHRKVFIIGSSQAREDFDVERLNKAFLKEGIIFYNFGISGAASPVDMFMLCRKLLEKKPECIIYVTYIESFYRDRYDFVRMRRYFHPSIMPYFIRYLGIGDILANRGYFIDSFLAYLIPAYKFRDSFKNIFYQVAMGYLGKKESALSQGFVYKDSLPTEYFTEEIRRTGGDKYKRTEYTALNEALFSVFNQDIISNKIRLIVLNGPTHPLIRHCYKEEIELAYYNFLNKQAAHFGFAYLDKISLPEFSKSDFIDFTHLNKNGREKLTDFIEDFFKTEFYN